jgi:aminoglycoside phosphotransferase (APT) family kinase protein
MGTFQPNLDLLRRALGPQIREIRGELIKTTFPWSLVYRVTLPSQGHSKLQSIIVKAIDPKGPSDPPEAERELHFYRSVYPQLTLPKPVVYFIGPDKTSGWNVIIMEDLSSAYRIPKHPYQWTRKELQAVLRAYAILHSSSIVPPESNRKWLNPRHENQLDLNTVCGQVETVQKAGIWDELPELPDLIAYARISCRKYADAAVALLHNDTTPTNAPLPADLDSQPAMLIDWQDAGIGMPEMDLAYIDLQPFHSARGIPRHELLFTYWQMRAKIEGNIGSPEERVKRQLHADLIMALWLTRPASRVATHPHPQGSYPQMHWDSQFGIVYNRLKALALEINP